MINQAAKNDINVLQSMIKDIESKLSYEGFTSPLRDAMSLPAMTKKEAEEANTDALKNCTKYREIIKRLENGEQVEGYMDGDF